ncbi:rhamnogalacturonan acetylesterase [Eubacteriales bacterium OttesenSCG-928-A19]|nr:rhamnogalacturonan acetylesterase [Eubacteriales bacterium OttesenSCG-928-A19]
MKTIYIIGDSTVEDGHAPFFGWGGQLAGFLPEGCRVENHAIGGRSAKSFRDEGRFAPVEAALAPGDMLLIAFGHNDEKDDAARHTDPQTSFPETLERYVDAALAKQARPVLITSVSRCYFVSDGSLLYTHGEYPLAVRTLAARRSVPLIDLKARTRDLLRRLGPEGSKALFVHAAPGEYPDLPDGWHDNTHFNLHGARTVARMVAEALTRMD